MLGHVCGRAKENYDALTEEVTKFLYEYVKGMVRGWDPETAGFVLQFRHSRESTMTGRPQALIVDIMVPQTNVCTI